MEAASWFGNRAVQIVFGAQSQKQAECDSHDAAPREGLLTEILRIFVGFFALMGQFS